jgi:hypothetical protein
MAVSGVSLSVAVKVKVADVLVVRTAGFARIVVSGASRSASLVSGGEAPSVWQTMPAHCSRMTLPVALLPPPSMLVPGNGRPGVSGFSPASMP